MHPKNLDCCHGRKWKLQKSSLQCLSDLKQAQKNAKVISCPWQPIPAILMCATMRWQLESHTAHVPAILYQYQLAHAVV